MTCALTFGLVERARECDTRDRRSHKQIAVRKNRYSICSNFCNVVCSLTLGFSSICCLPADVTELRSIGAIPLYAGLSANSQVLEITIFACVCLQRPISRSFCRETP